MTLQKRNEFLPFCPPTITEEEVNAVSEVVRSGWLSMGKKVAEFEEAFAKYCGVKHAIAVNSCTSALFLSYFVAGIKKGDEVITTPMTFCATINTILHLGAKPVLVDVDPVHHCIDPEQIRKAITKRTKAIVPVHFGGAPCDMKEIMEIAKEHQLVVIEDAAHNVGGTYDGTTKIGGLGNLTCFSFYATKNMTTGEGGMITTNDDALATRLKLLRLHGMNRDAWKRYSSSGTWYYDVVEPGYKMNMTDMNAALGLAQLKGLDGFCVQRERIVERYNGLLKDLPVELPWNKRGKVWHIYPIQIIVGNRGIIIEQLKGLNVGTSVFFIPIHYHPAYKTLGYKQGDFPNAEQYYKRTIALPLYAHLKDEDVEYVAKCLKSLLPASTKSNTVVG